MSCKFCFRDKSKNCNLNIDYKKVIDLIRQDKRIDEINIAGGEPTLYKGLLDLIKYCKAKELQVSLITNGIKLINDKNLLNDICKIVCCLGISIDSLNLEINKQIGRITNTNQTITLDDLIYINNATKLNNIKFKINIVVNSLNWNDTSLIELNKLDIDRCKILFNQNDKLSITNSQFDYFVKWFTKNIKARKIVIENDMNNSYLMITSDFDISIILDEKFNLIDNPKKLSELADKIETSYLYKNRYK